MTINNIDEVVDVIGKFGISMEEVGVNFSTAVSMARPSTVMECVGMEVVEGFSDGLAYGDFTDNHKNDMARKFGYIETMLMPDGARCEVIDGYDVVPLSESEYCDLPISTSYSMDLDKPNNLIEF